MIEQVYDARATVEAVHRIDEMIERALADVEKLVALRALLTGEDPLGDRAAQRQAEEMLLQRQAEFAARNPEAASNARTWARDVLRRTRRGEAGPSDAVRLAVDVALQRRQMLRLRREVVSERMRDALTTWFEAGGEPSAGRE